MSAGMTEAHADTRMMGIVHSALRRDLARLSVVLGQGDASDDRRRAIAAHVHWLMAFLHQHHEAEDEGLYPQILSRNPGAADVLAVMAADHQGIEPAIGALERAADAYGAGTPGSATGLLEALDAMACTLLPHLTREERLMMPIVSDTITDAEWQAWDQEFNIKPKAMRVLADEAHWVLDGLDEESSRFVEHLVPPVPRFIVLRLLGGRYRRTRRVLWDGTPAAAIGSLSIEAHEDHVRRADGHP
jgi:hemerythrin-like domain-containing protein